MTDTGKTAPQFDVVSYLESRDWSDEVGLDAFLGFWEIENAQDLQGLNRDDLLRLPKVYYRGLEVRDEGPDWCTLIATKDDGYILKGNFLIGAGLTQEEATIDSLVRYFNVQRARWEGINRDLFRRQAGLPVAVE